MADPAGFASIGRLPPIDRESGLLNAIIETPKGRRNKYKFNEQLGIFSLSAVLSEGSVFPYDFGFLPGTKASDGDPIDVLVLMEEPAFSGCLVKARLIGAIEAEQTEKDGQTVRNDRLLAVADDCPVYTDVHTIDDLSTGLVTQIEHFFVSYNAIRDKRFKPVGRAGPDAARKLIEEASGSPS